MRVIEQLVQHFWERGMLSQDEVHFLVGQGFARAESLEGYHTTGVTDPSAELEYDAEWEEPYAQGWETKEDRDGVEAAKAIFHEELETELAARRSPRKKLVGAGRRHRKSARRKIATVRAVSRRGVASLREWAMRNRHREFAATLLGLLGNESYQAKRQRNLLLGLPEIRALGLGRRGRS